MVQIIKGDNTMYRLIFIQIVLVFIEGLTMADADVAKVKNLVYLMFITSGKLI